MVNVKRSRFFTLIMPSYVRVNTSFCRCNAVFEECVVFCGFSMIKPPGRFLYTVKRFSVKSTTCQLCKGVSKHLYLNNCFMIVLIYHFSLYQSPTEIRSV